MNLLLIFQKPALTVAQQVELLIRRGMQITDKNRVQNYLTHINYYRLRAYWLPFETINSNPTDEHQFQADTTFEKVLNLYIFDRELRLLLLDAIERVEISLRTRWAHVLALKYGSFAHENIKIFSNQTIWQLGFDELVKEYKRSQETFVEHFRQKYAKLSSPPIWASCEMMMLGQLSRWLKNLKLPLDRQAIADAYNLDEKVLISFIHHLSIIRNHCAHHCRVWNRKFSLQMRLPAKKPPDLLANFNAQDNRRLYNTLVMLSYLFDQFSPGSSWQQRVIDLIKNNPQINPANMGFPADWKQRPIWKNHFLKQKMNTLK